MLAQRLAQAKAERQQWEAKTTQAEQALTQAQTALQETLQQLRGWQNKVAQYEIEYKERQRPERPHSRLAKARAKRKTRWGSGISARWLGTIIEGGWVSSTATSPPMPA